MTRATPAHLPASRNRAVYLAQVASRPVGMRKRLDSGYRLVWTTWSSLNSASPQGPFSTPIRST
jgi:hypothetical protein